MATTMMIEPSSPTASRSRGSARLAPGESAVRAPTGTPATRSSIARAVVGLHEHADGVAADACASSLRDAVPVPPLNP